MHLSDPAFPSEGGFGAQSVSYTHLDVYKRQVYVRLTDLGREQCRRLNAIFAAAEEEALRGFSPQEMQQVQTLLERIYRNLNN